MEKIDFVVTWVDGNDPEWLKERTKYSSSSKASDESIIRFRDWGLMRYWFRGVEKFAPWVNKVYFVTCGHCPEWLNLEHPKLKIVKHEEYIPPENLPTFNSNVIELYLHNISELSEQFVLFNDDMFILDHVKESDFFQHGLPCETVRLGQTFGESTEDVFAYTQFNNIAIINKNFSKKQVIKSYWYKFLSLKTGKELIRNLLLLPFGHFSGFLDSHLPTSHLKSTFFEVWKKERIVMEESGKHRFRNKDDVTHWLIKNWRVCQGKFVPRSIDWGHPFEIGNPAVIKAVEDKKYRTICINDNNPHLNFACCQKEIVDAFEKILPEKSAFER